MRAAVIPGAGQPPVVLAVPRPAMADELVIVRSHSVGICGTDLEIREGRRPAELVRYPVTPGHEWSGTVAAVGAGVRDISVGTTVVVEGLRWCGHCRACRLGQTNLCERDYDELGFTRPGGLAELVAVPASAVHALPSGFDPEAAALLEPAAVVMHGYLRAPLDPGSTVAVIGDGTLGQLAARMARLLGAGRVTMLGREPSRLNAATDVDAVVDLGAVEARSALGTALPARGADLVFETAGAAAAVRDAVTLARRGGRVVLEGLAGTGARVELDSDAFVLGHLHVVGVAGAVPASWVRAIDLAACGRLALADLISHRFPLDDVAQAFHTAAERPAGTMKVLIQHAAASA